MRRRRAIYALAMTLVASALGLAACGGDDAEEPTTTPPPAEAPSGGATPPGSAPNTGALPPGIAECLADQGFEIESPADLHSAPQAVLEQCFNALHQGGGAP